jgi:hypothetical protein
MALHKWTYMVVELLDDVESQNDRLDEFGDKGWELVSVAVQRNGEVFAYFKIRLGRSE